MTEKKTKVYKQGDPTPPKADDDGIHCRRCGTVLPRGRTSFCSDDCRKQWWSAHQERVFHRSIGASVCQCCGAPIFEYQHRRRKYCSHECYIRARFGTWASRKHPEAKPVQKEEKHEETVPMVYYSRGAGIIITTIEEFQSFFGKG